MTPHPQPWLFCFSCVQRRRRHLKKTRKSRPTHNFSISFPPSSKRRKTRHFDTGRSPFSSEKLTNQQDINELKISQLVCIFTTPLLVTHHNPLHIVAALPPWKNAQQKLQQWTTDHTPENSRKAPLTSDRSATRPTKNDMSEPPCTALPRVRIPG